MELIKKEDRAVFNTDWICRGFFIMGKHRSWSGARNGLVARVGLTELAVQFVPDVPGAASHYRIRAEDVSGGEWELKISPDMVMVEEVGGHGAL